MPSANLEKEVLDELRRRKIHSLVLQFTDLLGVNKAVELPATRFERALAGEIAFDGSALEGFARTEEADALLVPDLTTFRVFSWGMGPSLSSGEAGGDQVGRLICDIRYPDGRPFEGCPRTALKRQIDLAAKAGFVMRVGCEVEFFVFEAGDDGGFSTRDRKSTRLNSSHPSISYAVFSLKKKRGSRMDIPRPAPAESSPPALDCTAAFPDLPPERHLAPRINSARRMFEPGLPLPH